MKKYLFLLMIVASGIWSQKVSCQSTQDIDIVLRKTVTQDGMVFNIYDVKNENGDLITSVGVPAYPDLTTGNTVATTEIEQSEFGYAELISIKDVPDENLSDIVIPTYINSGNYRYPVTKISECSNSKEYSITIPSGVTALGDYVIGGKIKELRIPATIERISYLFAHNSSLESLIIEDSDRDLMIACGKWSEFYETAPFPETIKSVYIGRSLYLYDNEESYFWGFRLFRNTSLAEVKFGPMVKELSSNLFYECPDLKEITLPDELKTIEGKLFAYCSNLKTIHIPAKCSTIKEQAFYYGNNSATFYSHAEEPPVGEDVFEAGLNNRRVLYVPIGSKDKYMAVEPWKSSFMRSNVHELDFASIESIETESPEEIINTGVIEYYNLSGVKVSGDNLPSGIYLRRQGTKIEKIVIK